MKKNTIKASLFALIMAATAASESFINAATLVGSNGAHVGYVPSGAFSIHTGEFKMKVVNAADAATAAKRIVICPGKFDTVADIVTKGFAADGILTEGLVAGDVTFTANDPKRSIDEFLKEMLWNGVNITKIIVSTSTEETFEQTIQMGSGSGFIKGEEKGVDLTGYADEYQQNPKKATINLRANNEVIPCNRESIIIWPFSPGTHTLTFMVEYLVPNFGSVPVKL